MNFGKQENAKNGTEIKVERAYVKPVTKKCV